MLTLLTLSLLAVLRFSEGVVLFGICDSSNTCTEPNTFCWTQDTCNKGRCVCNSGYVYRLGTTGCVAEVLLGASCTTYCTYGTCTSGTCQCASGFTASADKRHCLGKSLGESCTVTSDCQGRFEITRLANTVTCLGGTCKCATGYKTYNSYTCVWYGDQEACDSTTQCAPGASCTSGKCTCQTVGGTQYVYRTISLGDGKSSAGTCVHPSSQEVGYGQTCTISATDATTKYCSQGLYCSQCPEYSGQLNNFKCLSGAAHLHVSLLLIALAGIIVALLK